MSHAELHFHLLPGVDDGPASVEESIALAAAALADGTGTIVATPHVHRLHVTDPSEIRGRVDELAARLRGEGLGLELRPGGELADDMVGRLSQRQLESIAHGPPGRRWVLLEAPFRGMDEDFRAAADELRERGFAALVAHPERAMEGSAAPAMLDRELAAGSAVQLTAGSLTGELGEREHAAALRILRLAPAVVIASDAHGPNRMPALRGALAALAAAGWRDGESPVSALPRALLERGLERPAATLVA
ncbi:MAG: hypothetical protein JO168_28550 [Solirubrobacterales bacterium]|nr:hypothetical protein [Solirubrobacterales bacterium]